MSSLIGLLSAAVLGLFLNGAAFAAETSPAKEPPKSNAKEGPAKNKTTKTKKAKVQRFVGDISAVDTKTGSVTVKGTAGEKNFMTQDAAKDALERLAVGDRVRVRYTEKDGQLVAPSVRRLKLPQAKTKATEENTKRKSSKSANQQKQTQDPDK